MNGNAACARTANLPNIGVIRLLINNLMIDVIAWTKSDSTRRRTRAGFVEVVRVDLDEEKR